MTCTSVALPTGGRALVCSSTRRCPCRRRATLLCDWKVPGNASGTCDAPLCARCTTSPAADKDLCAKHAAAWNERTAARRQADVSTRLQGEV